MKQFLTVIQGKKFLLHSFLILSAIWFIGPFVAIAGKVPFAFLSNRIYATLAVFLFLFTLEYKRTTKTFSAHNNFSDEIKQELQTLQKNLQITLKNLHNSSILSFLFRYKKPWYLVLGPTNAGKSTLLNKANLNIKGLDNLPPMMITPTKSFNWWLADDAVFIDVGGRYLRESKETLSMEQLFQGFFKLLKRYRSFKPINGLILTVNLQELTINPKEHSQLQRLRQVINELILQFVDFPIYLLITRSDMIDGFVEFFEDLGPEERNQIFGVSFPLSAEPQTLPQFFNEEYNSLLTRLNERIIWRLEQENNLDKIAKIKNFPLQMEFLKNPLAKLLNAILPSTQVNLRGIFFTSTFQKDIPIDNLTKSLSHAYDIHHINSSHRSTQAKGFFISEIFKRIIFPETKFFTANNGDDRVHFITSLLIVFLTATCVYFFLNSYRYNLLAIKNIHTALTHASQATTTNQDPLFNKLNLLQASISTYRNLKGPWYATLGMQQASKLEKKAQSIYKDLLRTEFLNYLQRTVEIQLQNTQEGNTNQLYAALKVYLMLGDHKHFDKHFFSTWFNNYWHQLNNNDAALNQHLDKHLNALYEYEFKELSLSPQLIEAKRAVLNNIPQSRLVLTILENQYQRSPVRIVADVKVNSFKNIPREISGIFNILNFRNVYYKEIENTCKEITHGDWVLGKNPGPSFSDIAFNQLLSEVKAIYLNEYAVTWADILAKIKIDEFQNLTQIVEWVNLLNDPQSPLIQLINTIRNNTAPLSDSIEFNQQVSSRFLSLNTLSTELLKNTNQTQLVTVKEYLSKIMLAPDLDKACYDAAKGRMMNQNLPDALTTLLQQAKLLPEPIQTWHTTIAAESWRQILKNTQNYLNKIWSSSIYPQYVALIDKRYPLFKESATDMSLSDFASFFGNGGTMDVFFKNYLEPFVDNTRLYWEWKNVDGQRINIPQPTLEMFIRAALIQKMFFPEEARLPAISFSLVPVELDAAIQSFSLDLEGQSVLFQKDNEQILSLSWPGPQPNHSEISFTNDQAKKSVITESGPWSWFKILDKAHIESTTSPKHFRVSFEMNGHAARYELFTNNIVNPFIPGILNAFRCPPNL